MNTTTDTTMIAQSLVTCHYATSMPSLTAFNRRASSRLTNSAFASSDAARVYNRLFTSRGTPIGEAVSLLQTTGAKIRRIGLLCQTGGIYLRIKDIPIVQNIFDDAIVELDEIRERILQDYNAMIDGSVRRLGDFANEIRIPTATEVASKFTMSMTIVNQPTSIDSIPLLGLADEVANRVRAESNKQVQDMLLAAHSGPISELIEVAAEFSDRLRNATRFHTSGFEKVATEARRVEELNILGINEITEIAEEIRDIVKTPDQITQHSRDNIAAKVDRAIVKANKTLEALGL